MSEVPLCWEMGGGAAHGGRRGTADDSEKTWDMGPKSCAIGPKWPVIGPKSTRIVCHGGILYEKAHRFIKIWQRSFLHSNFVTGNIR